MDITTWRGAFAQLLRGADRVIAPSQDVASRMRRYVPDLAIEVWPHPEGMPAPLSRTVRVGILGNLSPEKGLHVVAACARDARERGLPLTFRVLGSTTEPIAQAPDAPLTIYGQYVDSELPHLIGEEKPDVLLFAAQVPETYATRCPSRCPRAFPSLPRRSAHSRSGSPATPAARPCPGTPRRTSGMTR
jgi:glycosyltransferase involved in cell wall biosynthesis